MQNSFNIGSANEKKQNDSPITCYPLHSSFESEFGKGSFCDKTTKNNTGRFPTKRWNAESRGSQVFGEGSMKCSSNTTGSKKFNNQRETTEIRDVIGNTTSWNLVMDSVKGDCWSALSRPGQIQGNPTWLYPGFFMPNGTRLREYQSNAISPVSRVYCRTNQQEFSSSVVESKGNFVSTKTGIASNVTSKSSLGRPIGFELTTRSVCKEAQKSVHNRPMMCNFCKNNKEVPDIYLNHYLYDPKTKKLTCPVLRKHVCEICGGTGDRAHTLQYCPVNRQRGLQAKIPVLLKTRTITNSTGKIRKN